MKFTLISSFRYVIVLLNYYCFWSVLYSQWSLQMDSSFMFSALLKDEDMMLSESGLTPKLSQFTQANRQPFVVYGDPAYGVTQNIIAPFRGASQEHAFNKSMSKVRVSVEWAFGKITQYFTYVDFKRNSKVLLQPVGKYYIIAALLTNCHTCLYGSITTSFFKCNPPS